MEHMSEENTFNTGRDLNWAVTQDQIGRMTVAAISGGRVVRMGPSTVDLPVSSGYKVRITLAADDTYTVERVMIRGAKTFPKGKVEGVYCDMLSDVAYEAGMYRSNDFG